MSFERLFRLGALGDVEAEDEYPFDLATGADVRRVNSVYPPLLVEVRREQIELVLHALALERGTNVLLGPGEGLAADHLARVAADKLVLRVTEPLDVGLIVEAVTT